MPILINSLLWCQCGYTAVTEKKNGNTVAWLSQFQAKKFMVNSFSFSIFTGIHRFYYPNPEKNTWPPFEQWKCELQLFFNFFVHVICLAFNTPRTKQHGEIHRHLRVTVNQAIVSHLFVSSLKCVSFLFFAWKGQTKLQKSTLVYISKEGCAFIVHVLFRP